MTAPELLVPIDTSQGPVPHSASPVAHADVVATICETDIALPKPVVPVAFCAPNDNMTTPRGTFFAWSHAAARITGTAVSIGNTSRPRT